MWTRPRRVALALALTSVVVAPAAAAAPSTSFTPAQIAEAEERFRDGRALYEAGRIDEARLKYAQAYAVLDRASILWNLAVSEFHAGRTLEAYRHFRELVARPDADAEAVRRAREKYLPEAAARIGRVAVEAPPGSVVRIDGELAPGVAPFGEPFAVTPGPHTVVGTRGDAHDEQSVVAEAGVVTPVRLSLPGEAPPVLVVEVPRRETASPTRAAVSLGLGAGALVAGGFGVAFSIDSQSKRTATDEARAVLPDGACADAASPERLDAQRASATAAAVSYAVAGALATGAVLTWFLWPRATRGDQPEPRAHVGPWFVPGSAGVVAGGIF